LKETEMASTTLNGHSQRKTLSTQLDRLDVILDGLAEALNESVADAVKDVVGQVVRESVETTIREVLANQDLLKAALARHGAPMTTPVTSQPVPSQPSMWRRLGNAMQAGWNWVKNKAAQVADVIGQAADACVNVVAAGVVNAWSCGKSLVSSAWALLLLVWLVVSQFRTPLLIASSIGVVIGVGCYCAGPLVASAFSGITTFAGSFIAVIVRMARRELAAFSPQKS
jgi:hypothetical protein